jgi:hypothetical protein
MANGAFLSDDGKNWLVRIEPELIAAGKPQNSPDTYSAGKLLKLLLRPAVGTSSEENLKNLFREFSVSKYFIEARYGMLTLRVHIFIICDIIMKEIITHKFRFLAYFFFNLYNDDKALLIDNQK